jgi:hypothetical protein
MNNDDHKRRLQGLAPLAVGTLIGIAVMHLMPCRTEITAAETGAAIAARDDLPGILGVKDAAIELADQRYSELVDSADNTYEQSLSRARTYWSRKVDDAKSTAVADLKALGARLAAVGQLGETVKVLKAVYALKPHDGAAAKALLAAGVDLKAIPSEPGYVARCHSRQPCKIVIWNTHNGRQNTSGALQCNVVLLESGRLVWRADKVDLPWRQDTDTFVAVKPPTSQFDTVRVEITKWRGYSGGLTEIEIWRDGKNIALNGTTRASAAADVRTTSARVTDGVTTSTAYKNGYWLLPDNRAGWVEVSLARPAYQKLFRAKISARKPWQKTLEVAAGDVIDITASGRWRASPQIVAGPDGGAISGGDQWGKFRDRFYLQGRLGEDEEVFKIGSKFTFRATKAGYLELGMNEKKPDWYKNNSGFLDVTLTLRKRPPDLKSSSVSKNIATANAGGGVGVSR